MATMEQYFLIVPQTPDDLAHLQEQVTEIRHTLEWKGFMLHEVKPAIEADGTEIRWSVPDGREGACEQYEYRKTIDYTREERRAARRSGQRLEPNQFKSILPAGWQVIQPDDPRLQVPPAAEGDQ